MLLFHALNVFQSKRNILDYVEDLIFTETEVGYSSEPHKILQGWTDFTKD